MRHDGHRETCEFPCSHKAQHTCNRCEIEFCREHLGYRGKEGGRKVTYCMECDGVMLREPKGWSFHAAEIYE